MSLHAALVIFAQDVHRYSVYLCILCVLSVTTLQKYGMLACPQA